VDSTGVPGQGATFHFTILANKIPIGRRSSRTEGLTCLEGKRVLIVDDNQTAGHPCQADCCLETGSHGRGIRTRGTRTLTDRGRTLSCRDPRSQMPGMDGPMLAGEIRGLPPARRSPDASLIDWLQAPVAPQVRFSAFLTKPIKASALFDALSCAVSSRTMPSRNQRFDTRPMTRTWAGDTLAHPGG